MNHRARRITSLALTITAVALLGAASADTASAQGYWVPAPPLPPPVMIPMHPIAPAFVSPVVPVVYPHSPFGLSYGQAHQLCQSHALSATSHYAVPTPVGFVPAGGPGFRRHFRRCMRNYGY